MTTDELIDALLAVAAVQDDHDCLERRAATRLAELENQVRYYEEKAVQ